MINKRSFDAFQFVARMLAASWLAVAVSVSDSVAAMPEGCEFFNQRLECAYAAPTYQIRLPPTLTPEKKTPVIVILHDAGGTGAAIVGRDDLIDPFLARGYAVIAPEGLQRRNRRGSYGTERPSILESSDTIHPFKYSEKRFVMKDGDGTIRTLRWRKDTGWYFWNTDRIFYSIGDFGGGVDSDFIGRDEVRALRNILASAAKNYGTAPRASIMAGLGHGGSLVWQIACYAPDMAEVFAPVGGGFWHDVPSNCEPGARLIHTHSKNSEFWPLEGVGGGETRYARTSIYRNLDMLVGVNACLPSEEGMTAGGEGFSLIRWSDCAYGGPVELIVTETDLAFPGWWLDELTSRVETEAEDGSEQSGEPQEGGPVFLGVGGGAGKSAEADAGPESGEDIREEATESRPAFKKPGSKSGSRFKRAR